MIPIADSHSDYTGYGIVGSAKGRLFDHADLERMEKGGIALQGFAVWVPPESDDRFGQTMRQIDFLNCLITKSDGRIRLCTNKDDMAADTPIKAILAIESGETIDCKVELIQRVYDLGARILSLTWNDENGFAHGCMSNGGLKPRGIEAITELDRLNIALDMSHINETGFWEAAQEYHGAPCATHSCVYDMVPCPRNLKKDQIVYIIKNGGYIGINFYPEFLKGRTATVDDILNHIEYILMCGGEDNVGLGSDFCGIQYTPDGLDSVADIQKIPAAMARRGYAPSLILKICYGNFSDYILKFL